MRVGVYVPEVDPQSGGATTFIRDVLGALASAHSGHEFHVLYSGPTPPDGSLGLPSVQVPDQTSPQDSPLDATATRVGLDIVWFLVPQPQAQSVTLPFIATVWDLEHRRQPFFPEVSVSGWTWEERESHYRSTLPRAVFVVVGTTEGKRQVEDYYAVPSSSIAVVPFLPPKFLPEQLAARPEHLAELGVSSPFLFYPAQFWPHKNHTVLLHALKRLKEQGCLLDLVLTGADQGNLAHVRAVAKELGVDSQTRFLGFVDRASLVSLYRNAAALLFPSFFGPDNLPPLEAFALGCPVVAAATPGTAELLGDAAVLVDPTDDSAWADAVLSLVRSPIRRSELVERGLARTTQSPPIDYVRAITSRLDALEPVRRCWSRMEPYKHSGARGVHDRLAQSKGIDVTSRRLELLEEQLAKSEADRAERLNVIHSLQRALGESEADRAERLNVIHSLQRELAESKADRAERLNVIHSLQRQLAEGEADRVARLDVVHSLQAQLVVSEADRSATKHAIAGLKRQLAESQVDRAANLATTQTLEEALGASESEKAARQRAIQALEVDLGASHAALRELRTELGSARQRIEDLERSRSWRWTAPIRSLFDIVKK